MISSHVISSHVCESRFGPNGIFHGKTWQTNLPKAHRKIPGTISLLSHLTLLAPATPGTRHLTGAPWSAGSGSPFLNGDGK